MLRATYDQTPATHRRASGIAAEMWAAVAAADGPSAIFFYSLHKLSSTTKTQTIFERVALGYVVVWGLEKEVSRARRGSSRGSVRQGKGSARAAYALSISINFLSFECFFLFLICSKTLSALLFAELWSYSTHVSRLHNSTNKDARRTGTQNLCMVTLNRSKSNELRYIILLFLTEKKKKVTVASMIGEE